MYTMKEACDKTGLSYETLKYYCKEGLVPDVKRDSNNNRLFEDKDIKFINGLICLRKCGLSIKEMKIYVDLIEKGDSTIPERQEMLKEKKNLLKQKLKEVQDSIDYIDWKQSYYRKQLKNKG